jgi:ribosomal silencing factor RsfS
MNNHTKRLEPSHATESKEKKTYRKNKLINIDVERKQRKNWMLTAEHPIHINIFHSQPQLHTIVMSIRQL